MAISTRDTEGRPDPDALLERVKAEESQRAKLRIWFGASPGVGKTFAMLENAQRLRKEGAEIVVGLVETHGRRETMELLNGLEQIPRKNVPYRGRMLDEFDLDGALVRKPKILLLDELAHTNAPGSRHKKRWQDVMELLDAGIEVHTTVNVQHVESLNDVIAQITHVRVRETIPDAIIERADQIELVDVAPEVVIDRLKEGKVYIAEQAERAAGHFFKVGNLHALRELALRLTAEHVDADVQEWRRQHGIATTWAARERLMVCVSPSPESARLVRAGRRMATALRAPWMATYVEGRQALSEASRAHLTAHLRLAESLGGEVVVVSGDKPADALLDLARERNVTRIVVGKPTHPRWRDLVFGSMLDDLVRGSGEAIDVHVIAGDPEETPAPRPRVHRRRGRASIASYVRSLIPIAVATGVGLLLRGHVDLADIAMIFLVAIATTSVLFTRGASLFASVLAVGAFDFFFVEPLYTIAVSDLRHVPTFAVMLCSALFIGGLMSRIRQHTAAVRRRERRTASLYTLTRALARARDVEAIASVTAAQLRDVFESRAALLVPAKDGTLECPVFTELELPEAELMVVRWAFEHGKPAGRGSATLPGARVLAMPLLAAGRSVGVVAVSPSPEDRFDDPEQRNLLETFIAQIALALERAQLADDAQEVGLRAEAEEMRRSLLSSVSHDLRPPVRALLGTATTLLESSERLSAEQHRELHTTVRDEAARLDRIVANLIDMMRVESGGLDVKREWVPVAEIVRAATTRLEARIADREVNLDVPEEIVVPVDPMLIEQVFLNLIENALKHTPQETPIDVRARRRRDTVTFEVADRGPGLPSESANIFDKFVRGTRGAGGAGLGLTIVRGIVYAHGGTITAINRPGGGSVFRVKIPVGAQRTRVADDNAPGEDALGLDSALHDSAV